MTRLYVIGAEGQIARSLREAAAVQPHLVVGFGARPNVDLARPPSVFDAISAFKPDIVVNPAAYTAVDRAESEPELAFAINRDGARVVARASRECRASIIHLSTDYVFDGTKVGPYLENDEPNPRGVYGQSKLEGEVAVAEENPRHIILRTSWVYAPFGQNFVRTMLRIGNERDRVRVVNDRYGCPTYAPDVARAILEIARESSEFRPRCAGVTHICGTNVMSWYEFAQEIFRHSEARGGPSPVVDPINSSEYPTAAARPANSELSTERLLAAFNIRLPPTAVSLSACLDRLFAQGGVS